MEVKNFDETLSELNELVTEFKIKPTKKKSLEIRKALISFKKNATKFKRELIALDKQGYRS